jgi:hypothetical protein
MEHDPRPRYVAAGALFLVGALVTLVAGVPLLTLLLALAAAGCFYWLAKAQSVS